MRNPWLILSTFLWPFLVNTSQAADPAIELQDNTQYAQMQQCLAAAEQSHNLNTQLDRYCIDSFLATTIHSDSIQQD